MPCLALMPMPCLPAQVPMLMEAQLLHARCMYLNGNLEGAQRKAADILRTNPEEHTVHLLICRWG